MNDLLKIDFLGAITAIDNGLLTLTLSNYSSNIVFILTSQACLSLQDAKAGNCRSCLLNLFQSISLNHRYP